MTDSRKTLKFADEHLEALKDGVKTVTVRKVDMYEEIDPGDRLDLVDESCEEFGETKVSGVSRMPSDTFVGCDYEGHRSYRSVGQFLDQMRGYYPETDWGPSTRVAVVYLDRVSVDESYFRGDPRER